MATLFLAKIGPWEVICGGALVVRRWSFPRGPFAGAALFSTCEPVLLNGSSVALWKCVVNIVHEIFFVQNHANDKQIHFFKNTCMLIENSVFRISGLEYIYMWGEPD